MLPLFAMRDGKKNTVYKILSEFTCNNQHSDTNCINFNIQFNDL